MQSTWQLYDIHEIIALITSTVIGTGAYVGFLVLKKEQKVSKAFIFWTFIINLFFTYIASEILVRLALGEYRSIALPVVAYMGQYFVDWIDQRYPQIFDAGARKAGLDIRNDNNNNDIIINEDQYGEDNYEGGME